MLRTNNRERRRENKGFGFARQGSRNFSRISIIKVLRDMANVAFLGLPTSAAVVATAFFAALVDEGVGDGGGGVRMGDLHFWI